MNYENTQRVIPLINTINKEEVKMNHHGARGYRFEMEVLGAFYASPSYVLNENLRLLTGDRGYCDGVIHSGYMNGNTFVKQLKVCEIEVKLRNGVGKEPRAALIDALLESKTFNFLSHNLHLNHGNPRRIFVLGLTTDLETQRSQGVCSYDQYGEIVVVYFHKQWSQFEEYERRQAIRYLQGLPEASKVRIHGPYDLRARDYQKVGVPTMVLDRITRPIDANKMLADPTLTTDLLTHAMAHVPHHP